jgi:hypothetical protein
VPRHRSDTASQIFRDGMVEGARGETVSKRTREAAAGSW